MGFNEKVYVIDAGNTAIKVALFEENKPVEVKRLKYVDLLKEDSYLNQNEKFRFGSSVLNEVRNQELKSIFPNLLFFDDKTKLPIKLNYKTTQTLGRDRICNAVAAYSLFPHNNTLSIDIGTCVKYDFVSYKGIYEGGAISPGINLRYKSLNEFTDNLPLIEAKTEVELLGKSTYESIHSGVINGIYAEIIQTIKRYRCEFDDLKIIITGGDTKYFDFNGKKDTFVEENLTLKGLFQIFLLNV